jgi:hypothetical protein
MFKSASVNKQPIIDNIITSKQSSIYDLARDAMNYFNDTDEAKQYLYEKIMSDSALLKALIDQAVKISSMASVQSAVNNKRAMIMKSVHNSGESVVFLANGILHAILDMPIAGGKALRNATRDDLAAQFQIYESRANDMKVKARWMQLLESNTPDGKTVGEVMDNNGAYNLLQRAQRELNHA